MIRRGNPNRSKSSPLAGCIVGPLFLAIGLAVVFFAWKWIGAQVLEVRQWTQVPCVVTKWDVGITPAGADIFEAALDLTYQYQFNGQSYHGTVLDASMGTRDGLNDLEEAGAAARAGGQVCYVNPADPVQSSLRPGSWWLPAAVSGFGLLFASVGGMVFLSSAGAWLRKMKGGEAVPPASGRKGCLGVLMPPVFCLIFAGAGVAVWKFAIHDTPDWKTIAPRMVELPAKVIASGVDRHTSSGKNRSTTYKAKVAFTYQFQGRDWHSGWLDFDCGSTSSSNRGAAEERAARHPAGQNTTCWVDPQAPWRAVLEKERGSKVWLWIFPILFGGLGLLGFAAWCFKILRRLLRLE